MVSAAALVHGVFPDGVAVAWAEIGDVTAQLWPEEAALVARAVPKRQREFARGRVCAREALALLGVAPVGLLSGPQREPLWPDGVVGSITHDQSLCVAAVAHGEKYAGLGVDIEPAAPLEAKIAERIWSPAEAELAAGRTELPPGVASRLVFSAKEAVYKCQFPVTRAFVGFMEVHIVLGDGTFEARFENDVGPLPRGTRLNGQWRLAGGELLTAVALPLAR